MALVSASLTCITGVLLVRGLFLGPAMPALWAAACLGAAVSSGLRWSMPPMWRTTLGLWALVIALTWPVVAFREIDFTPALIYENGLAVTGEGVPAPLQFSFIASSALVLLAGILWIDLLWASYGRARARIVPEVIVPLAVGIMASVAVAFYQAFVDIQYLNTTQYAYLRRASGLLFDANAYGVMAALGGGIWLALAAASRAPAAGRTLMLAIALTCWAGVWLSGSRTAFLCVLIAAAFAVFAMRNGGVPKRALATAAAAAAVLTLTIVLSPRVRANIVGPMQRITEFARESAGGRIPTVLWGLWERDRYGTAAASMFLEHPISGIGVGSFHALVTDRMFAEVRPSIPPDNAQNWFRHQLVEFGVLGSIGWILFAGFVVRMLWLTLRLSPSPAQLIQTGTLLGLAAVSQLGIPTQSFPVLMTAASLFVWWRFQIADVSAAPVEQRRVHPALLWLFATAAVLTCAYASYFALRVPYRAAAAAWPYQYGLHALDGSATLPFRWTSEKAVAVFKVGGKYLRLRFYAQHPDIASRPVDVRVKLFGTTVIRERLRSDEEVIRYLEMPNGTRYVMLTFLVSRTFAAPLPDPRELGVAVDDWSFTDTPPPGYHVIGVPIALPPLRNP